MLVLFVLMPLRVLVRVRLLSGLPCLFAHSDGRRTSRRQKDILVEIVFIRLVSPRARELFSRVFCWFEQPVIHLIHIGANGKAMSHPWDTGIAAGSPLQQVPGLFHRP